MSSAETLVVVVNVFVAVEVEGKARTAFRESIVLRFLEIIILRIESRSSVDGMEPVLFGFLDDQRQNLEQV